MRVDASLLEPRPEPKICLQRGQVLATILRPGALEVGLRRSAMAKLDCFTGQMLLCPRDVEQWIRTEEIKVLKLFISDNAWSKPRGAGSSYAVWITCSMRKSARWWPRWMRSGWQDFRADSYSWIPLNKRLPLTWWIVMQRSGRCARCTERD